MQFAVVSFVVAPQQVRHTRVLQSIALIMRRLLYHTYVSYLWHIAVSTTCMYHTYVYEYAFTRRKSGGLVSFHCCCCTMYCRTSVHLCCFNTYRERDTLNTLHQYPVRVYSLGAAGCRYINIMMNEQQHSRLEQSGAKSQPELQVHVAPDPHVPWPLQWLGHAALTSTSRADKS